MGAFFLFDRSVNLDLAGAENLFSRKGLYFRKVFRFGSWEFWLYKKTKVPDDNFLEIGDNGIYLVGTAIYKNHTYNQGKNAILNDYLNKTLDLQELRGTFVIFLKVRDQIKILTDPGGIHNVFKMGNVYSSSFLALAYAAPNKLKINKLALTETLCTGGLIGPDTIISEINRYYISDSDFFNPFRIIEYRLPAKPWQKKRKVKRTEAVKEQIKILSSYFKTIKPFTDDAGVDSGLTGGFDSRLLFVLSKKIFKKVSFYSHYRSKEDKEISIAKELCKISGMDLKMIPVTPPFDMNSEHILNQLKEAFLFCDGNVRANMFWTEEYNTRQYIENLMADRMIGMSGIGGEQYRNVERLILPRRNFKKWFYFEIIFKQAGRCFKSRQEKKDIINYIAKKVMFLLDVRNTNVFNRLFIKRYLNEIYTPACRAARLNAENQARFSIAPFTDYIISGSAYRIIRNLGISNQFEADMIAYIDDKSASVNSVYGYPFNKKIPFRFKIETFIREFLPQLIYYRIRNALKKNTRSDNFERLIRKFPEIGEYIKILYDLKLPLDVDVLKRSSYLSPLLIGMAYMLFQLKEKLSYTDDQLN